MIKLHCALGFGLKDNKELLKGFKKMGTEDRQLWHGGESGVKGGHCEQEDQRGASCSLGCSNGPTEMIKAGRKVVRDGVKRHLVSRSV